jgi:hypothetical protein
MCSNGRRRSADHAPKAPVLNARSLSKRHLQAEGPDGRRGPGDPGTSPTLEGLPDLFIIEENACTHRGRL